MKYNYAIHKICLINNNDKVVCSVIHLWFYKTRQVCKVAVLIINDTRKDARMQDRL